MQLYTFVLAAPLVLGAVALAFDPTEEYRLAYRDLDLLAERGFDDFEDHSNGIYARMLSAGEVQKLVDMYHSSAARAASAEQRRDWRTAIRETQEY